MYNNQETFLINQINDSTLESIFYVRIDPFDTTSVSKVSILKDRSAPPYTQNGLATHFWAA